MWILPTMSRPQQCKDVIAHIIGTHCTTSGVVFVNGHSHKEEYEKLKLPPGWSMIIHPENLGACGALNWVFNNYPCQPFYGYIADDEYVYTKGWDAKLIREAGDWFVSHGNDKWQSGLRVQGYVCIGGALAREVGYLSIPGCWHWYGFDNLWETVAKNLGIQRFCTDVITEHKHFLNGKSAKDECYTLGESKKDDDAKIFQAWIESDAVTVLKKINDGINQ